MAANALLAAACAPLLAATDEQPAPLPTPALVRDSAEYAACL